MKCPNCNVDLIDNCCLRCGYLSNGNYIKKNNIEKDKFEDQRLYNKDFDNMYRNNKYHINFLLGPLCFSYRGHFILGILFVYLDYLLFMFLGPIFSKIGKISIFIYFLAFLYLFINRTIYAGFSNSLCLFIDNIRIKEIKRKYKENYKIKLEKHKHKKIYLLLTILFYIILIVCIAIYKRYKYGLM